MLNVDQLLRFALVIDYNYKSESSEICSIVSQQENATNERELIGLMTVPKISYDSMFSTTLAGDYIVVELLFLLTVDVIRICCFIS